MDGGVTAGWSARGVKNNLQVAFNTQSQLALQKIVSSAVARSRMLQAAVVPLSMTQAIFNRYDVGMEYGQHVDAAVMGAAGEMLRSDVAVTIFLSDPQSYTGGELVVNSRGVEHAFKLEAGAAIAYPADSLHHVAPVTSGSRQAAIIWVQSQVRDPGRREILWDLENAKRGIFEREGKSPVFDAVSKSHSNLIRMWAEI